MDYSNPAPATMRTEQKLAIVSTLLNLAEIDAPLHEFEMHSIQQVLNELDAELDLRFLLEFEKFRRRGASYASYNLRTLNDHDKKWFEEQLCSFFWTNSRNTAQERQFVLNVLKEAGVKSDTTDNTLTSLFELKLRRKREAAEKAAAKLNAASQKRLTEILEDDDRVVKSLNTEQKSTVLAMLYLVGICDGELNLLEKQFLDRVRKLLDISNTENSVLDVSLIIIRGEKYLFQMLNTMNSFQKEWFVTEVHGMVTVDYQLVDTKLLFLDSILEQIGVPFEKYQEFVRRSKNPVRSLNS